ncbi:MAG: preprotein translocase subunit SecA [Deltaproteobacteria bacterium]|jgi:preprotein translocase subunit SecA|nr:preprotein translocase subunit SecA [Deltaproteobacteria bacterium]
MLGFLRGLLKSANDREIGRLAERVDAINAWEPQIRALSDAGLQAKTAAFKERLERGEALESLLHEAFAVTREASLRVLGQRHFDVQLMGGLVLHDGKIAEMKTGEGKTLAATLPVYANALEGEGVHVVTVNDYLARRDSEWMGRIYRFLGLKVGTIVHGLSDAERREAYGADVTYGTNNEYGFDYLRDNMKFAATEFTQRDFHYAIVDEVDSILIDEARTPLIISGPAEKSTELYVKVDRLVRRFRLETDFTVDEKSRASTLTEEGIAKAQDFLGVANLYDPENIELLHHVTQALKAYAIFKKDRDYMVLNGKVVIVDEFTGRPMEGRRYSDGLHQALEAKEAVKVENENQTLASITFQNYFRMYKKLAGMTGTADTEAAEFSKIYNLDVVVMPTHRRMIRVDHADVIYQSQDEKYEAAVEKIRELHEKGQPVLVGTISIEKSERVSKMLLARGVKHEVLNAKQHEREAMIVAKAGQKGAVTISTNMAGRGTDIVLGPEVPALGGLAILGTERHESRRIDNQLRGRSGRQGDPGESLFFLSLEDYLFRAFGGERMRNFMKRFAIPRGQPISAPIISRGVENAQKHVESHHFDARKHILDYDDVMNRQREVVYQRRRKILFGEDILDEVYKLIDEESQAFVHAFFAKERDEPLNFPEIDLECRRRFGFSPNVDEILALDGDSRYDYFYEKGSEALARHVEGFPQSLRESAIKTMMLGILDDRWKTHLLSMDYVKEGINLRGYGQRDPLREYQREGFELFQELIAKIRVGTLAFLFAHRVAAEAPPPPRRAPLRLTYSGGASDSSSPASSSAAAVKGRKVGRNESCPCGSGKKYKHCCGA